MALSYITESEAPRDFHISTTESDGHYTKCLLCYTIKKNFYCVDCIRAGNFLHSSMPYSDRYSEKQGKLLRLRLNRRHIQDRCEKLLHSKSKHATLQTDLKQSKDRVALIKLAIEQRKKTLEEKKKELSTLVQQNTDLAQKLPKYEKRVSNVGRMIKKQQLELEALAVKTSDRGQDLAALRRARIRQLTKYIFPLYITYDTTESWEDMEFIQADDSPSPLANTRERLTVLSASLPADADLTQLHNTTWCGAEGSRSEAGGAGSGGCVAACAALCQLAQLAAALAWTLDVRLPDPTPRDEWRCPRSNEAARQWVWRLCRSSVSLCASSRLPPPLPSRPAHLLLQTLARAAALDDPALGCVDRAVDTSLSAAVEEWFDRCPYAHDAKDSEPEHLHWPTDTDSQLEEVSASPPIGVASSLVTSLASMWRGWTK